MSHFKFLISLFVLPFFSYSQNDNYHALQGFVDGSFVVVSSNTLKVKIDERYTDYDLSSLDYKVYLSKDNPLSGIVSSIANQSTGNSTIKRGKNFLDLNLGTSHAAGYYVLEIKDSKGEASYLSFNRN